jgi:serine/threonine protein phosphatase 1
MSNGPRSADPTVGELIYAIGDVHGCHDLLEALLALIVRDWRARAPGRRPLLVFCGDYVDRGLRSAEVIDTLIALQGRDDVRTVFLKGNHEQALMRFLDDPTQSAKWLRVGGVETLASYGVRAPQPDDPSACCLARDLLLERMPGSHRRFVEGLELMLVVGDYAFVHAGVRPGIDLASQCEDDLLWIRQAFLDDEGPFEKVIVHGHSWIDDQAQLLPQRIGIDTGAFATGVLTAVRLDGQGVELIQARANSPVTEPA